MTFAIQIQVCRYSVHESDVVLKISNAQTPLKKREELP
jgi:hypothetical protein